MGDSVFAMWFLGSLVIAGSAVFYWRTARRVKAARHWPIAEATIDSAEIAKVGRGPMAPELPCFSFSYVVKKQNYSGLFALKASGDRRDELIQQMVSKKMSIHYDPQMPQGWYIPVDTIGGCEVVQKLRLKPESSKAKD